MTPRRRPPRPAGYAHARFRLPPGPPARCTLQDYIDQPRPPGPAPGALRAFRSLLSALAGLAGRGLLHAGLSPACVALEPDWTVRVGRPDRLVHLARWAGLGPEEDSEGRHAYLAPELPALRPCSGCAGLRRIDLPRPDGGGGREDDSDGHGAHALALRQLPKAHVFAAG